MSPARGTAAAPDATDGDLVRQTAVAVSAAVAVVGGFIGSGAVIGTPIAEAAGGALAADATLVAPAGPAFSIWSVIYLGLVALAVHQALPAQRSDPRERRVGWLVAVSLLLNAAWILVVQAGSVVGSLVVIVALLAVLVVTFARLVRDAPTSRLQAVLLDGTLGLYLGWVSIATVANAAAALAEAGWARTGTVATVWAVGVLVVAAVVGAVLAATGRGRVAPAVALAWGLAWIAVGRTSGEPESLPVTIAAAAAAVVTIVTAMAVRTGLADRLRASR